MEVLYVCEGTLTNIIDGKQVIVRKGELLFLNQFTHHEILPAGQEDIAINFIILPEFLMCLRDDRQQQCTDGLSCEPSEKR